MNVKQMPYEALENMSVAVARGIGKLLVHIRALENINETLRKDQKQLIRINEMLKAEKWAALNENKKLQKKLQVIKQGGLIDQVA